MYRNFSQWLYIFATLVSLVAATGFFFNSNSLDKQLTKYHDSGQYYDDISSTIKEATYYLQFRLTQNHFSKHQRKLAIVMDIDETALSNYKQLVQAKFNVNNSNIRALEAEGEDTAIPYTLTLYHYAKDHGVAVFFITGRKTNLIDHTVSNLNKVGYKHWDGISFNKLEQVGSASTPYRIQQRKNIALKGYDIVINLGNRQETLNGGYSDMTFKLTNPFYQLT